MHHSLQANQQVTQRNIDYPPDAILVTTTDLNCVITYANRNFMRIAGYSREERFVTSSSPCRPRMTTSRPIDYPPQDRASSLVEVPVDS